LVATDRLTGVELAKVVAKVVAVLLVGILVQTCFGNDLRVDDVAPDFMLLLAVCAGFVAGPDEGALAGFVAGLLSDLFLQNTPFGLMALAACLAGYVVGWARASFLQPHPAIVPVVAGGGTALGVLLFVAIGYVVGQAQLVAPGEKWVAQVVFIEACYAAVFGLPAAMLMGWALKGPSAPPSSLPPPMRGGFSEFSARRRPSTPRSRRRRRVQARVR
jgi:rod shape-determining protein MreD